MSLINSDSWTSSSLFLKQLQFHPANPRLPELQGKVSEREIIHELCNRGTIEDLARTISEKGYFRNDRLIVFKEKGANIVYEGNRRLCALKVLDNPELAPPHLAKTFARLSEKTRLPKKIAVEIVPTRFDAEIVMYAKHAAPKFVVGWDPLQQNTFIAAKLAQGETIEDLQKSYGLSRDSIIDARASIDLYRLARLAKLTPEAQDAVDDPAKFPYSTVYERLFKPKKSRAALGVEISDAGLVVKSTEDKFLPVLARILDDAANEVINTRKLGTEEDQLKYIKKLRFTSGGGTFTAEEAEQKRKNNQSEAPPATRGASTQQQKTSRSARVDTKFLPKSLILGFQHVKLATLLQEGQKLEVAVVPHACAFLLRTLLEIALTVKLKALKHYHTLSKTARSQAFGPALSEMLDYANKNPQVFGLDPSAKIALEALVARSVKQSKPQLDRIVHNDAVLTDPKEIVAIREQALPFLQLLLNP